jgi:hypothetical protein
MTIYWLFNTFPRPIPYNDLARLYCDQDVSKTIEDITQMLYTAWHVFGGGFQVYFPDDFLRSIEDSHRPEGYNATHVDHPMTKWVQKCQTNYSTTALLGTALCDEYLVRYPESAPHACQVHIEALSTHVPPSIPIRARGDWHIPPICGVPEELKWSSCLSMGEMSCLCCHHYVKCTFNSDGTIPLRCLSAHNPSDSYRRYYTTVKMFEMDRFTYTNVPVPRFLLDSFQEQLRTRVWEELWPSLRLILQGHMREKECPFYRLPLETIGYIESYVLSWPYVKCSPLK